MKEFPDGANFEMELPLKFATKRFPDESKSLPYGPLMLPENVAASTHDVPDFSRMLTELSVQFDASMRPAESNGMPLGRSRRCHPCS